MEGRADPVQTGAFLIALRAKGETVPELVGLARTMRALAAPVSSRRTDLVDTAGTGGGPSTFNVSTRSHQPCSGCAPLRAWTQRGAQGYQAGQYYV
jgi:anthranilate phosphoribosyltransferase